MQEICLYHFVICAFSFSGHLLTCSLAVGPSSALQWEEQIQSATVGPTARFGHSEAALDWPAGVMYVCGGLVADGWNANETVPFRRRRGQICVWNKPAFGTNLRLEQICVWRASSGGGHSEDSKASEEVWMFDSHGQVSGSIRTPNIYDDPQICSSQNSHINIALAHLTPVLQTELGAGVSYARVESSRITQSTIFSHLNMHW